MDLHQQEVIPFRIITITACTHVGNPIMFYTLAHYLDLHRDQHPEINRYISHSGTRINADTSLRTFYTYIKFYLNLAPQSSKNNIVVRIYERGSIHICGMQRPEDANVLEECLKRIFLAAHRQPLEVLTLDPIRHVWKCKHNYIFGKPSATATLEATPLYLIPIGHLVSLDGKDEDGDDDDHHKSNIVMNGHIVRLLEAPNTPPAYVAKIKRRIDYDHFGQIYSSPPTSMIASSSINPSSMKCQGRFPIQTNLHDPIMLETKWTWRYVMINGHTSSLRPNWEPFRAMHSGFKCLELLKEYLQTEHPYLMTSFDPNSENIRVMIYWMQTTGRPLVTVSVAPNGAFTVYAAKSVDMMRMVTIYTTQILMEFLELQMSEAQYHANQNVLSTVV